MQLTQTAAYQSGIDGLPEPAKVTKHILLRDAFTEEILEGDVETEQSVRNRLAWSKGSQGPFPLFERWIAGRLESLERRVAVMDVGESFDSGHGIVKLEGVTPETIHTEEGLQAFMRLTDHLEDPRNEKVEVPDLEEAERMRRVQQRSE